MAVGGIGDQFKNFFKSIGDDFKAFGKKVENTFKEPDAKTDPEGNSKFNYYQSKGLFQIFSGIKNDKATRDAAAAEAAKNTIQPTTDNSQRYPNQKKSEGN